MSAFAALFGAPKPVIAMLHLGALPGRPRHDRTAGLEPIVEAVRRDLHVLQDAGVDGVMFCNEADLPYQLKVGPEITAAMAAVVGRLRPEVKVPFGVNLLWDPIASLAVARATGARWVREVMTGVYESDLGMIEPRIGEIAGYRTAIGAEDVLLFDNIQPEFASAVGNRTVADRARGAAFLGVDATHQRTGRWGAVRDERPSSRKGGFLRHASHRQHGCAGRAHRRDFPGGRWRDRRDQPQGGRRDLESGGSGAGKTAGCGSGPGPVEPLAGVSRDP